MTLHSEDTDELLNFYSQSNIFHLTETGVCLSWNTISASGLGVLMTGEITAQLSLFPLLIKYLNPNRTVTLPKSGCSFETAGLKSAGISWES